ncbi:MAG: helix-turn-helix domain-containing GNAT family N-acetyltransferase [Gemmatimonadaceae bacterium]
MSARSSKRSVDGHVATVRRFNRDYTRLVGVLDERHLQSAFSLTEGRLLFEIAHHDAATASLLIAKLGLDAGYLSRLIGRLERRRLVRRTRSSTDGREWHLSLTPSGRAAFRSLDEQASDEVAKLLAPLDDAARRRVVESMGTIATLLGASDKSASEEEPAFVLRPPRAGDLGWVVQRHGELYEREYGWNERFIALVARVVANYIEGRDEARERCWIAERRGTNVGSVFVMKHPERPGVAKLRLLLVEPSARGLGVGRRLVDECTRFARDAGYHTISLWTNSVLESARRIYAAAGYRLVREEVHDTFGPTLTAETWELALATHPTS